jgi:hypothetical protein
MSNTIFYTQCSSGVSSAISARRAAYGNTGVRTSEHHSWLYKKMIFAEATATPDPKKTYSPARSTKTLSTPIGGGISDNGLYTYQKGTGYTPKPAIEAIRLYNTGDWGSVLRCELEFSVYSLSDLDSCQPFFDLGSILSVKFGWTGCPSNFFNGNVSFKGYIINFSYSVNPDGSFKCTSTALSEGTNAVLINANSATYSGGTDGKTEAADETKISKNTIVGILNANRNQFSNSESDTQYGVEAFKFANDFDNSDGDDEANYYITLAILTAAVNRILAIKGTTKIIANETYTKGYIPKTADKVPFVSADPRKILFPGFAKYNNKDFDAFINESFKTRFKNGELSQILINIDWIISILAEEEMMIKDLYKRILDEIYECSGRRYTLTLAILPEDPSTMVITDPNYFDSKLTPEVLTAVTNGSVCRSISLTSKVPAAMAVQAYYADGFSGNTPIGPTDEITGTNTDAEAKKKSEIETLKTSLNDTVKVLSKFLGPTRYTPTKTDGDLETIIMNLKRYLADIHFKLDQESISKKLIPFPVDFTATLDGINGFVFGNAVTTNYLPTVYKQEKIVFTVTKVEHAVTKNDWTTTLSTVCRIAPKTTN